MAAATAAGSTEDSARIEALSVARLTEASATPETARMAFSTLATQDAQVIPTMPSSRLSGPGDFRDCALGSSVADMVNLILADLHVEIGLPIMGMSRGGHHTCYVIDFKGADSPAQDLTLPRWQAPF